MPTRKLKTTNNLLKETTYKVIPKIPNYLISNLGCVYKKSTWKKIAVINNIVILTINKKRYSLSIPKLMNELFSNSDISYCYVNSGNSSNSISSISKGSIKPNTTNKPIRPNTTTNTTNTTTKRSAVSILPRKEVFVSNEELVLLERINNYRLELGELKINSLILCTQEELSTYKELFPNEYSAVFSTGAK